MAIQPIKTLTTRLDSLRAGKQDNTGPRVIPGDPSKRRPMSPLTGFSSSLPTETNDPKQTPTPTAAKPVGSSMAAPATGFGPGTPSAPSAAPAPGAPASVNAPKPAAPTGGMFTPSPIEASRVARPDVAGMAGGALGFDPSKRSNPADIAAEMMNDNSKLMRAASTFGRQQGNARGMLNSSITAGAATNEALKQVIPLATQASDQRFKADTARQGFMMALTTNAQQFGYTSQLSEQAAAQKLDQVKVDYREKGLLSRQEFEQDSSLSDQDFKQKHGLSKQKYESDMKLQEKRLGNEVLLASMDAANRQKLMEMETKMRTDLAKLDISADERKAASDMVTNMHQMYEESFKSIMANPDLKAEDRTAMINSRQRTLALQTAMIEDLYKIDLKWEMPKSLPTAPTTTTTPATTPSTTPSTPTYPLYPETIEDNPGGNS